MLISVTDLAYMKGRQQSSGTATYERALTKAAKHDYLMHDVHHAAFMQSFLQALGQ